MNKTMGAELIQVTDTCYYFQSPAKVGLVRQNETEVVLIDSGSDKSAGRDIRKVLDANGWRLSAIYCTHSHADHIGGNKYLQSQTGCPIYAPGIERCFTQYPLLEPSFLYGAYPHLALRSKFLQAQPSEAGELTDKNLPVGFSCIPLPGHFFDMVGYRTADDVVYLADAVASRETLKKYRICFLYDIAAHLRTLDAIEHMEARMFIPAHADATEDIADLARCNKEHTLDVAEKISALTRHPINFDTLLQRLFCDYNLRMTHEQYTLIGSTVRSYLSWLLDTGKIDAFFENNMMLWQAH